MADGLSLILAALADPTRRAMLARLEQGEATVLELAEPFDLKLPTVSKHLKVLQRAGLVSQGRRAQWRPCRLEPTTLQDVADWIERNRPRTPTRAPVRGQRPQATRELRSNRLSGSHWLPWNTTTWTVVAPIISATSPRAARPASRGTRRPGDREARSGVSSCDRKRRAGAVKQQPQIAKSFTKR
jgi:DNA-binding transcriptional ArsR family regulator